MTNEELLQVLQNGNPISVSYFDGAMLEIYRCDGLTPEEIIPPLKNFLALTAEQRRTDSRHLFSYYKLMVEVVGEEVILEDMGGVEPIMEQIWDHVKPKLIFFDTLEAGKYVSKPTIYVHLEGEVVWEPEHGLMMSWAEGNRLVKVSSYDGHPTNGYGMDDPTKDQYVFYCDIPELCTFPDGM